MDGIENEVICSKIPENEHWKRISHAKEAGEEVMRLQSNHKKHWPNYVNVEM